MRVFIFGLCQKNTAIHNIAGGTAVSPVPPDHPLKLNQNVQILYTRTTTQHAMRVFIFGLCQKNTAIHNIAGGTAVSSVPPDHPLKLNQNVQILYTRTTTQHAMRVFIFGLCQKNTAIHNIAGGTAVSPVPPDHPLKLNQNVQILYTRTTTQHAMRVFIFGLCQKNTAIHNIAGGTAVSPVPPDHPLKLNQNVQILYTRTSTQHAMRVFIFGLCQKNTAIHNIAGGTAVSPVPPDHPLKLNQNVQILYTRTTTQHAMRVFIFGLCQKNTAIHNIAGGTAVSSVPPDHPLKLNQNVQILYTRTTTQHAMRVFIFGLCQKNTAIHNIAGGTAVSPVLPDHPLKLNQNVQILYTRTTTQHAMRVFIFGLCQKNTAIHNIAGGTAVSPVPPDHPLKLNQNVQILYTRTSTQHAMRVFIFGLCQKNTAIHNIAGGTAVSPVPPDHPLKLNQNVQILYTRTTTQHAMRVFIFGLCQKNTAIHNIAGGTAVSPVPSDHPLKLNQNVQILYTRTTTQHAMRVFIFGLCQKNTAIHNIAGGTAVSPVPPDHPLFFQPKWDRV
ncbi:uncharacterized protein LOC127526250 [Erpetoichthys calabaricus]|uniref:uncharacterized protein LOC127526250 n=1 Tax=Erpetoichthys calabaricus TaxID=27687 RepID=UPI0022347082|nr:uncharacterized protein LOC127526250 [Erpetoichthys calabaricus]